ncbi:MAG: FAD-binding oxidoreductase [Anaerolineae bacterium]|nr:FAD-binding oxidoreductase [Anaerolineae bacterium]
MTVSLWQANNHQPTRDVDFLVVGAGIVGCSAAYFAAQAGRQVVITEMRDLALGASSRNAGMIVVGVDSNYPLPVFREMWALSQRTQDFLLDMARRGNVPFSRSGSIALAETSAEARELEQQARLFDDEGIDCEYVSHDPFDRGWCAALRKPDDALVQPYELAQAVYQQSGAELVANNELYHISQELPDVVTVYTRQFIFKARHVLLCTNAYSVHIDPYFVGKVTPTRGQCLATVPLPNTPLLDNAACHSDHGYFYFRDTFDGRLLIGGGRKTNKILEGSTTDDRTTEAVQRTLEAYLHRHFPDIEAPIERRWAGIMGFSVDGLPLVGTLPDQPRVGFAVGFTGHGLALGAGTAERAVDMLLKGASVGAVDVARLS